ncbi:hypothetical protein DQ237_03445 [Blastococcus sp. TF02-8]|uniref:hypothetical protein n=1 Tax=Blastococcus sp. TF02-8 TaxID=2250574 RepID=UPI000DE8A62D|nr:hypothetical protein [Blastococcus sp. TF02-8]RBY97960.1 hypothetical protein DQ237_03445 [Blastococcus sp. TF02-8]
MGSTERPFDGKAFAFNAGLALVGGGAGRAISGAWRNSAFARMGRHAAGGLARQPRAQQIGFNMLTNGSLALMGYSNAWHVKRRR